MEGPRAPEGALASLRTLGATLAEAAGTRVELAIVELREEGERRKGFLALAFVGAVFLAMGLLLAAFFVVVLFWDTHRVAAIAAVTLLYVAIGVGSLLHLRAKARAAPPPFEATLRELAADRDMLRSARE